MPSTAIDLPTPDGPCHTQLFTPDGTGPWPGVIYFFDAGGQRPASSEMAARLASLGYVVAIPDLFHRAGPIANLFPPGTKVTLEAFRTVWSDPELKAKFLSKWYGPALDYENLRKDIGAVLDHFAQRPDVRGGVGTTGYCMGGNASVRAATLFGDRIKATAAFHPGGLVTPAPDSPHRRVGSIKSTVYLGPAIGDLPDDARAELEKALEAADVKHTIESYNAQHGYAVPDAPVYDPAAAEHHWQALAKLFGATLHA